MLGFHASRRQRNACRVDEAAGGDELHAAMGEIHGDGGEGGVSGVSRGGEPDAGGESERAADGRVSGKAGRFVRRLRYAVRGDGDNEMSLLLPNGSRIVGLPGNEATVRGFFGGVFAAGGRSEPGGGRDVPGDPPMLVVSDGALWLMSTPFGKRGFFYDTWANGGPEWERVQVRAEDCPRIRREVLEEERRRWATYGTGRSIFVSFCRERGLFVPAGGSGWYEDDLEPVPARINTDERR